MIYPRQILFLLLLPVFCFSQKGEDKKRVDSIFAAVARMPDDTHKVNFINHEHYDYLWAFDLADDYNNLKHALKISKNLGYKKGEYESYNNMAHFCTRQSNSYFQLEFRRHALQAAVQLNDTQKMATQWAGIGLTLSGMSEPDSALWYMLKAKKVIERSGDKDRMARLYSHLAGVYNSLGNDSMCEYLQLKALQLRREINYRAGIGASLIILRWVYIAQKKTDKVVAITNELLAFDKENHNDAAIGSHYNILGDVYQSEGDLAKALQYQNEALKLGLKTNDRNLLKSIYGSLSSLLEKTGNKGKALEYLKLHYHLKDSLDGQEEKKKMVNLTAMYDVENKNKEIELLNQDQQIKSMEIEKKQKDIEGQRIFLFALGGGALALLVLAAVVFAGYRQKKRDAHVLSAQKKIIEQKNQDITDSINYAQRIQQAILHTEGDIQKAFAEAFVLFRPKDIVSGDFYWFAESDYNRIIAVADCTGHGVPGGFMSMLGYEMLQDVLLKKEVETAAEALHQLDIRVTGTLNKGSRTRDGMDMALCAFSRTENILQFSGANRPLIHVSGGEMKEYRPDKHTIGGAIDNIDKKFTNQEIAVKKGDVFYLFSDGYADQFGGPKGKKLMYKNLQEKFSAISGKPMAEQKKILEQTFDEWKGTLEQVDDVCIIGIRI